MKKKIINTFIAIIFSLTASAFCMADELRPPWEAPEETYFVKLKDTPAAQKKADKKGEPASFETNPAKIPFLWWLRFYQNFVSPIDGDKCGMYPTCSDYSMRAIKKHGAAIGIMMTVDRLFHEGTELKRAPLIEKYGVIRYYDPVDNNDFWFAKDD
jgi:putative membrane protein insertion efficiency factor